MTAFLRPVRWEFTLIGVIIVLALGLARFWAADGGDWMWLSLFGTAVFFAYAASNWPALHALDIPRRRWLGQALATATAWAVVLAVIQTVAATLMQHDSPYYAYYDWFLATSGTYENIDTNGDPYILEGMGITAGSIAWTFIIALLMFLIFAILGLAIGLAWKRWPQLVGLVLAGIIGLILLAVYSYIKFWSLDPWVVAQFRAAGHFRVGMILIAAVVPLLAAAWTIRRGLRNPWG